MWASISNVFSPATIAKSSEVNENFDDVKNQLNTAMPSGGIIMWSGAVVDIPTGWNLCNGNNSTPDLRGKFIVGAGGDYNPADSGGEERHTLTTNEMPVHTHIQNAHRHAYSHGSDTTSSGYAADTNNGSPTQYTEYTTATNQNAGGGASHENRPPYYALCYIMKS